MTLPDGASFAPGETDRIRKALEVLEADPHAPRTMPVEVILHLHHEYPKHVTVGKDKDGAPITKIAASEAEETALREGMAAELPE